MDYTFSEKVQELSLRNDIELMKIQNQFLFESAILEIESPYMESEEEVQVADTKKQNRFLEMCKKVIRSIRKLIKDFIDTITTAFSKKEHMTSDDYKASQTGQVRLSHDIEKMSAVADQELKKSRSLIQKLLNPTGSSKEDIDGFIKASKSILLTEGPIALGHVARRNARKKIKNDMKTKDNIMEETEQMIENATKSNKNVSNENAADVNKLLNHMGGVAKEFMKAASELFNAAEKEGK